MEAVQNGVAVETKKVKKVSRKVVKPVVMPEICKGAVAVRFRAGTKTKYAADCIMEGSGSAADYVQKLQTKFPSMTKGASQMIVAEAIAALRKLGADVQWSGKAGEVTGTYAIKGWDSKKVTG